jgi:hypothetical protein
MIRIFVLICFCLSININAQSFTFTAEHTSISDTLDSTVIFDLLLKNTGDDTLTLYIKWESMNFPEGWEYSVCFDDNCFPPFVDSITTTEEYSSSPLLPGDERLLTVDLFPKINFGSGSVKITAGNMANLDDSVVIVVNLDVNNPVSVKDEYIPVSFRLLQNYPNPFNPSTEILFEVKERSSLVLDIFSISGEKVASIAEGEYAPGLYRKSFDASLLSSGLYIARLSSGKNSSVIKLMLEK